MGQDPNKIEKTYDALAKEYAEAFSGEHEKKPKDREMLQRFSREIGDGKPVWVHKHCAQCMRCIMRCPKVCIQYGPHTRRKGRYFFKEGL